VSLLCDSIFVCTIIWVVSLLDLAALCYVDGSRETANAEKVKEAHKRVMVANHPDAGGSHYLASKINEAKDVLTGKTKGGGSAF